MKTYTVSFYSLINCGGIWQSDGTTAISGYDEEFSTESYEEALKEFEERKGIITRDNKLGVTLSTWEDDEEVGQEDYSSEDIKEDESIKEIVEGVQWGGVK
ncbi:hypothetical protein ACWG0P_14005 [Amedibacillus sp. YH-ame6]